MSKPSAAASAAKSASPSAAQPAGLTFEKALAELEKIVSRMESGELSLEQALATHKRGVELARFCQQRLEAAQQQVKVLEGEVLKPLPPLQEAEPGEGG
ncbi:MAG TPA: exodeoxyribonuclease VII small subunit [Burkholderiales bacterium]|nr:exodeoxyribonuclease VII small subunit [Burkholderiales bacterium]